MDNPPKKTDAVDWVSLKTQLSIEILPDLAGLPVKLGSELEALSADIAENIVNAIALGRKDLSDELTSQMYALGRIRNISIGSSTLLAVARTAGIVIRTFGAALVM